MSSSSSVGSESTLGSLTTVDETEQKLLSLLQPVFSQHNVKRCKLLGEPIVQASAVGYRCKLEYNNKDKNDETRPSSVFVKHVDAAVYAQTKKDWNDLRRALIYSRTECRFYRDFLAQQMTTDVANMMPAIYHSQYNLKDLIDEDEHSTDAGPARDDMPTQDVVANKGGLLVMELVDTEKDYYQTSPLKIDQCKQCLAAIAALHNSAWENVELLRKAEKALSIPTFHLQLRNPKELANIEKAWDHFRSEFKEYMDENFYDRTADLGSRIQHQAQYISDQLSPTPDSPYATLVHGDLKAMNAFLPRKDTSSAKLVDFASVGIGYGMMDVAMHIHHAVMPEDLELYGEMKLVDYYLQQLNVDTYSKDVAYRHYKLAVLDYFRFFLGRMWATATPTTMKHKEQNPNINNINRYPKAAMAFLYRAERYLTDLEQERSETEV